MKSKLSPYLLEVLRLKARGLTNAAIAEKLGHPEQTIEKYSVRTKAWLIENGWWDAPTASRTAWGHVGRRYLAAIGEEPQEQDVPLSSTELVSDDLVGFLRKFVDEIQEVRIRGDLELAVKWEELSTDALVGAFRKKLPDASDTQILGNSLLKVAYDLCHKQQRFRDSLIWFRAAEVAYGKGSNQAAQAARDRVGFLWQLGAHDEARKELRRIEEVYGLIMDLQTKARLWQMQGTLDLYDGNLNSAAQFLKGCQSIARELGDDLLSDHHFLARTYLEMGRKSPDKQNWYFQQVAKEIELAVIQARTEEHLAFHLLVKAQLYRLQRNWKDALEVRDTIRPLFGNTLAASHLRLEEARIALLRGDINMPLHVADEALTGWMQINFAKGIADALQLKAYAKIEVTPDLAFQYLVAALCVYPFENHPGNDTLIKAIEALARDADRKDLRKWVMNTRNKIEMKSGPFEQLSFVKAERELRIKQVIEWLDDLYKGDKESIGLVFRL